MTQPAPKNLARSDADVTIRVAELNDLPGLTLLDSEVFGTLAYPPFVLRQLFDVHRDSWYVAVHPTAGLVGYSLAAATLDRATAWLLALAVSDRQRGKGYGRLLVEATLEKLRKERVAQAELTVEPTNKPAIALYRSLGFTEGDHIADYLGPGEDRLTMVHHLLG